MAALSQATENRLFLLGAGLTTCAILGLMRQMLIHYRNSAEVEHIPQKTQYITQNTEDALKVSTLGKLVVSHNHDIRETASRIITDRAIHDDATLNALLWEVTRPDYDRRVRGVRILHMLQGASYLKVMTGLDKPQTYSAIVTSLGFSVTDQPHKKYDQEFDTWVFRDVAERYCLLFLERLVNDFGAEGAVRAGFVDRWLAKEPWGDTEDEIRANFAHLFHRDNVTAALVQAIARHPEGGKQLEKAKLVKDMKSLINDTIDVRMTNGEGTAGEVLSNPTILDGRPRPREQSVEEERVRRRHREAMVFNNGVEPLGRDDIFEREDDTGLNYSNETL